jgi:pyruvate dehydrogenase E2 component (dihydrolipoamide acetyltransferase)
MITKIVMPQLSLSMQFGVVTNWYKPEGSYVEQGEPVCEIEGDKALTEIEAPVAGYLVKILAQEMEEFPVKEPMAYIADSVSELVPSTAEEGHATVDEEPLRATEQAPGSVPQTASVIKASPVAKRLASELGIDLSKVVGTGQDGLIGRNDVLAAKEALEKSVSTSGTPRPTVLEEYTDQKLTGIKKLTAEKMKESYSSAPHIELALSVNMQEASKFRDELNQKTQDQPHITFTDILVWAVSRTLVNHPLLNASFQNDSIRLFNRKNIGLASVTEKGLVVPVIREADHLNMPDIATKRQDLLERVRGGKQTPEDLSEGTFTITNLGMFGIEWFKPIISPGQSAILAVGKIKNKPVADETGKLFVTPVMHLILACDHRVMDGADGAKFLSDLKTLLENPVE